MPTWISNIPPQYRHAIVSNLHSAPSSMPLDIKYSHPGAPPVPSSFSFGASAGMFGHGPMTMPHPKAAIAYEPAAVPSDTGSAATGSAPVLALADGPRPHDSDSDDAETELEAMEKAMVLAHKVRETATSEDKKAKAAAKKEATKMAKEAGIAPPAEAVGVKKLSKGALLSKTLKADKGGSAGKASAPKAKAAPEGKAGGGCKKGQAVLKRPASDYPDMTQVWKDLKACSLAGVTRGAFTSRAHGRAKTLALKAGLAKEDAMEFARVQYGYACELYAKRTS